MEKENNLEIVKFEYINYKGINQTIIRSRKRGSDFLKENTKENGKRER